MLEFTKVCIWSLCFRSRPGYREFIPEFRAMTDAEWKDYVMHHVPPFMKPRVDELNGELPPEGLWPEALEKAEVG